MQQRAAILLTVHNLRERTLECLRDCYQQIDAMKGDDTYSFTVYMVDDGSVDGTSELVTANYPQTVIIRGDGNLYWNHGMTAAWEAAAKEGYDFYLWLHSGTMLKEGSLACIMETSMFLRHKAIVAATAEDPEGNLVRGGRDKSGRIIVPDPAIPTPCYTFDGNFVLVPAGVYKALGGLDWHYTHRFGDIDYGVRAYKSKIVRVVAPGVLCRCNPRKYLPVWRDRSYSLKERVAFLYSPKGRPPREQFRYDCRSQGVAYAIFHGMYVALKVFFPKKADV